MGSLWDWLVVAFAGDHIAIFGPRLAGKTTRYDFLTTGEMNAGGRDPPCQAVARHPGAPGSTVEGGDRRQFRE